MKASKTTSAAARQVARHLIAEYIEGDYTEITQLEYRYEAETGFGLYTRIRGKDVRKDKHRTFFDALSEILDDLPFDSYIKIAHQVIVLYNDHREVVTLEERWSPYKVRDAGTVVYELQVELDGKLYESETRHAEFPPLDAGTAFASLFKKLPHSCQIHICFFCKYLVPFNDWGGTDYRHDQMYCVREKPELLETVYATKPKVAPHLPLLEKDALPNVDALHTCAAFDWNPGGVDDIVKSAL